MFSSQRKWYLKWETLKQIHNTIIIPKDSWSEHRTNISRHSQSTRKHQPGTATRQKNDHEENRNIYIKYWGTFKNHHITCYRRYTRWLTTIITKPKRKTGPATSIERATTESITLMTLFDLPNPSLSILYTCTLWTAFPAAMHVSASNSARRQKSTGSWSIWTFKFFCDYRWLWRCYFKRAKFK